MEQWWIFSNPYTKHSCYHIYVHTSNNYPWNNCVRFKKYIYVLVLFAGNMFWILAKCSKYSSALWILMPWCFSTRASVATVLRTHPCVIRSFGVKWGINNTVLIYVWIMNFVWGSWYKTVIKGQLTKGCNSALMVTLFCHDDIQKLINDSLGALNNWNDWGKIQSLSFS